jgi:hypothetical protein
LIDLNGIELLEYLTDTHTQVLSATTVEQFEALLPWNIKEKLQQSAAQSSLTATTPNPTARPKASTRFIVAMDYG